MTEEMRTLMTETAHARGVSVAAWVAALVARELGLSGYELPPNK